MSRLIDADKLIEEMSKWYWDKEKQKASEEDVSPMDLFTHLAITTVQEQPTAFDLDEVMKQLKSRKSRATILQEENTSDYYEGQSDAFEIAVEIVKWGDVE